MTKFSPSRDLVLIKEIKQDSRTTSGGILLPDTMDPEVKNGIVVEAGPGKRNKSNPEEFLGVRVSKGMRVIFHGYAGVEIEINGEDFFLLPEDDILGYEE